MIPCFLPIWEVWRARANPTAGAVYFMDLLSSERQRFEIHAISQAAKDSPPPMLPMTLPTLLRSNRRIRPSAHGFLRNSTSPSWRLGRRRPLRLPPRLVPLPLLCGILLCLGRAAVVVLVRIAAPTPVAPLRAIRPSPRSVRNVVVNPIPPFMVVSKATSPIR